jgi:RES domain
MAKLELTEDLHFIDLFSTGGLTRIGADGRLFTGSYKIAQHWSAALRAHPSKPDGIRYPSRHDHARVAYAIYSRPASTFKVISLGSLMALPNRALLNDILKVYRVELLWLHPTKCATPDRRIPQPSFLYTCPDKNFGAIPLR